MTPIENRAEKLNDVYKCDLKYLFEILFTLPENEWILVDNSTQENKYSVCFELFKMNLICKKTEPIFRNGLFCGNKHYFKYNKELKY